MKVLIACEESQRVCIAFRERERWRNNGDNLRRESEKGNRI